MHFSAQTVRRFGFSIATTGQAETPEGAEPGVAAHDGAVLVVGSGGDNGSGGKRREGRGNPGDQHSHAIRSAIAYEIRFDR